jgi:hypothetical protein
LALPIRYRVQNDGFDWPFHRVAGTCRVEENLRILVTGIKMVAFRREAWVYIRERKEMTEEMTEAVPPIKPKSTGDQCPRKESETKDIGCWLMRLNTLP